MIIARRLLVTALLLATAGCSTPTAPATSVAPPPPAAVAPIARTAEQIVADLTAKISTAKTSVVFTADNDPNHLLGRPNGYTSRASFTDNRIKETAVKDTRSGSVDQGGTVEVFADDAGAVARKKYIDDTMKAVPILGTEYSWTDGPVLLRVSQVLTPDQAAEYEAALQSN